jgi:hypothetical protein
MMEETIERGTNGGRGYRANRHKWYAQHYRRYYWGRANVRRLAQQAGCFVLPIRMFVDRDL